jgi:hypothetical protein
VTNRSLRVPSLVAVMSQGPLMPCPERVSRTVPWLSSTSRQPGSAVAEVPPVVGRLPTTTQPPGRTDSAVVRPIPPGQGPGRFAESIRANW